jgi:hypothetical protein
MIEIPNPETFSVNFDQERGCSFDRGSSMRSGSGFAKTIKSTIEAAA